MKFLLGVFGVVLIFEGLPWFLSPVRVRAVLEQLARTSDGLLRFFGLLCMLAGLLLVYLSR
jgi:uncharacterized protein YjeT (DUF2065 family)